MRPGSRTAPASVHDQRSVDLSAWGLVLIFMIYVLYVPVGPHLIYNEDVYGPSALADKLRTIWSVGRYAAALIIAPMLLMTGSGMRPLARCWPMLPFAIFAAASIAWSAYPKESMREFFNLFAMMTLSSTLVSWCGLSGYGRRVQIVTGVLMIASVLTALLAPTLGVHHAYDVIEPSHAGRWRGIFLHKNVLGGVAIISIIFSLRSIRKESAAWRLFFSVARICAVACFIMAGSASALGGGLVALVFYVLIRNRATANPLIIGALILIGAALVHGLSLNTGHVAEALGRDTTFNGRTEIWALGRSMIQSHLLFGSGFGADGAIFGGQARRDLFTSAVDLHSGYLDILFNLGLVGAVLMLIAVATAMVRGYGYAQTHSGEERDEVIIFMTLIVSALAIAFVETSPVSVLGDGAIGLWTALPALYQLGATTWRPVGAAASRRDGHGRRKRRPPRLAKPANA
jgi:O-antigen ligase